MEATVAPPPEVRSLAVPRAAALPWHLFAVVFAATSIAIGIEWDISWHKTIGRDTFWTPAHMAIYLGGLVSGLASGWVVLRTTFGASAADRATSVRFWGFRGPLGAWACIWGAIAMLTSAPFDDWWHAAYGLDVEILSPPHAILALGIVAITIGALLFALALQNRSAAGGIHLHQNVGATATEDDGAGAAGRVYRAAYAYLGGLLLLAAAIMTTQYTHRVLMHGSIFYKVVCGVFPFFLVGAARASRLPWPATTIAGVYMAVRLAMVWILPLFPAEPRLGPIFQDVSRMVPLDFPLLLVAPALAVDLTLRRFGAEGREWLLSVALGGAFFATFLVVQWFFADFLMSPHSRNWFFATDNFFYGLPKTSYPYLSIYYPADSGEDALRQGLFVALGLSIASTRLGLWLGGWMRRVRR